MILISQAALAYDEHVRPRNFVRQKHFLALETWLDATNNWLSLHGLPAAQEFLGRLQVQRFASAPLDWLDRNRSSPGQAAISEAVLCLNRYAAAVLEGAETHREQLTRHLQARRDSHESLYGSETTAWPCSSFEELSQVLRGYTQGSTSTMTNALDYFATHHSEWLGLGDVDQSTTAVSSPGINPGYGLWAPEMNPIIAESGINIIAAFRYRCKAVFDVIDELAKYIRGVIQESTESWQATWSEARSQFQIAMQNVVETCITSKNGRLVSAAVTLARFVCAFSTDKLSWLDVPDSAYTTRKTLLIEMQNGRGCRPVLALRDALQTLEQFYDARDRSQTQLEEALSDSRLVLLEDAEAYWEGKSFSPKWQQLPWKLLWRLASSPGRSVQAYDIVEEPGNCRGWYSGIRHRLSKLIPESLDVLIEKGDLPESYKLTLSRKQISIIRPCT